MYEMQKNFLNFYAIYYDDMSVADSLQVDDDETNGILTTKEYYNIDKLWESKNGVQKSYFYAYIISGIIQKPKDVSRTMPFRIVYPAKYTEDVTINLPEGWDIEESNTSVNCAAYQLKANFIAGKKVVYLGFDYEALKDNVTVPEAKEALDGIAKFEDQMNYGLSYKADEMIPDDDTGSTSTSTSTSDANIIYTVLSVISVVVLLVFRTQRRN